MIKVDAKDITRNLAKDLQLTLEAIEAEVADDAKLILDSVKEETPVETGHARDGWEVVKESQTTVVKNDVEYIGFLDEGTAHHAGNHMVDKAIQKVTRKGK